MPNFDLTASPGRIPGANDPLGAGVPFSVARIPWTARSPTQYSFDIQGRGGLGNYTAPAVAVIEYYDPLSNSIVRDFQVIGGRQGSSRISILTGGSVDGSTLGTGEIQIAVYNLGGSPISVWAPATLGKIYKLINAVGQTADAFDAANTNSGFFITDMGGRVVTPADPDFAAAVRQSLGKQIIQPLGPPPPNCFLAGTPILMADGTEKPIEEVRAGDRVMSFDPTKDKGRGGLVPGEVARTFRNVTKTIIDLHGLKVTPGHRFLTGEGTFETIAEILRTDGTIITVDRDEVRARTNAMVGSPEDRPVRIVYREPASGRLRHVVARAGIPALFRADTPDRPLSTARFLQEAGIELLDDGMIREPGGRIVFCDWPEGATPLDLPLQRNFVVSIDGHPYVPEWIEGLSEEEDGLMEAVGDAGPRPFRSTPAPAGFRPTLAASNARPPNRSERRRAAALERVK